jgi:hypothetical protein
MRLAGIQMPPSLLPTWHPSLHHNNRLRLPSPLRLRVRKAYYSAKFFPTSTIFQLLVMALRVSAQGGRLNRACTIRSAIKEAYLTHQMSPTLFLRISGTVASTAMITTVNRLKLRVTKATRGHIAIYPSRLQFLQLPGKRRLESQPPLIQLELDLDLPLNSHVLSRS